MLSLTEQSFSDFTARDESEVVIHSDDAFAPVGFLHFKRLHVEQKKLKEVCKIGCFVPVNISLLLPVHNWTVYLEILAQGHNSGDQNKWWQYSPVQLKQAMFIIYGTQTMLVYWSWIFRLSKKVLMALDVSPFP